MDHMYSSRIIPCHEMLTHWIHKSTVIVLVISLLLTFVSSNYAENDQYSYYDGDEGPIFRVTNTNYTVGPGERAVLKCRVENIGTKYVTWRREGEQHPLTIGLFTFVSDNRVSVDYNPRTNEWSLIIESVRYEDEGIYHCTVATKASTDNTYEIRLNVKTVLVSGVNFVERSRPIQLTCNATGRDDPPHDLDWYKAGIKLQSDPERGIMISKKVEAKMLISVLVIQRSEMHDSGDYVCRSSDNEHASITVHILKVTNTPNVKRDSNNPEQTGAQHMSKSVVNRIDNYLIIFVIFYIILNNSRTLWS